MVKTRQNASAIQFKSAKPKLEARSTGGRCTVPSLSRAVLTIV
jgi:hypothetical protein